MYLKHFGFNREPFNITPDPEFLFLSPAHKEALASIIYGVEKRKGFITVLGEIGVGKTTILRSYLNKIDRDKVIAIYVLNPMLSFSNLLRVINRELGLSLSLLSSFEMVNQLHEHLVKEFAEGRNIVLIIDEAQNMPVDTLENLRMLSNIETAKEKLIQIVFSGQPEFEKTLNLPELKQLKQRISVKAVISPFSQATGITYIRSRLKKAATCESAPFTPYALKEIVRLSEGIPRVINILCDNCLITAFGYGEKVINSRIVKEVARDNGIERSIFCRPQLILLVTFICIICATLFAIVTPIVFNPHTENITSLGPNYTAARPNQQIVAPEEKTQTKQYVHKVVEKGDTLAKLVMEVYGKVDNKKLNMVKKANPNISNENLIVEGRGIRFPIEADH